MPAAQIDDHSTPGTIENWDSINGMKLVVALEEEYGIRFSEEEMRQMQSIKLMKYVVSTPISSNS